MLMTEDELQTYVVHWLQVALPLGSVFHHSPNEGKRHVAYKMRLKKLGMAAGCGVYCVTAKRLAHVEAYLKPLLHLRGTSQADIIRQMCEAEGG